MDITKKQRQILNDIENGEGCFAQIEQKIKDFLDKNIPNDEIEAMILCDLLLIKTIDMMQHLFGSDLTAEKLEDATRRFKEVAQQR
jgi:hypothetical protein